MFKTNTLKDKNKSATLQDVENSADEVMRSCAVQFKAIDDRFDRLESSIKGDMDNLYRIMISRFDAVDAKFDRMEEKFDRKFEESNRRFQAFELYMQGHEKRIRKVEKHLAFA
jgi:hypothetical protein